MKEQLEYLDEMREIVNSIEDSEEKMEFLFELGSEMEEFPQEDMVEENKVPGCVSNVYIKEECRDSKVYFKAFSEAMILRGYIQILLNAINGLTPNEIKEDIEKPIMEFLEQTNIKANLTPSRSNAFESILRMIQAKSHKCTR